MLRPPVVKTLGHTAKSKLDSRDGRIVLTQTFEEGDYHCGSAVAVGVCSVPVRASKETPDGVTTNGPALAFPGGMTTPGNRTAPQGTSKGGTPSPRIKVRQTRDGEMSLVVEPGKGSFTVFVSSTASFDKSEKIADAALAQLDAAVAKLPDDLAAEMRDLYLLKKPWEDRSEKSREYAGTKLPFSSRWNWIGNGKWENGRWVYTERGSGPYGPVTHIFSRGAKIAYVGEGVGACGERKCILPSRRQHDADVGLRSVHS